MSKAHWKPIPRDPRRRQSDMWRCARAVWGLMAAIGVLIVTLPDAGIAAARAADAATPAQGKPDEVIHASGTDSVQPALDPATIRSTTEEVLQRPEFRRSQQSDTMRALIEQVDAWLEAFGEWAEAHSQAAIALAIVLLLVALLLLAHIFYVAFGGIFTGRKTGSGSRYTDAETLLEGTARSWQEGLKKAREALAHGNARLAVWIGHRVLLGLLDQEGAIRFSGWKTNTTYLHECARDHACRAVLDRLTAIYEEVIYRHQTVPSDVVASLIKEVESYSEQSHAS